MTVLLGLDLSTRCAAAVAVPTGWAGDWSKVSSMTVGFELSKASSDEERARRTGEIARQIVDFARRCRATVAWFESYAYGMATNAHTLAEVGGVVRLELLRDGVALRTANMGSARKLVLGKIPRVKKRKKGEPPPPRAVRIQLLSPVVGELKAGSPKEAVVATLQTAGARFRTVDEYEAFVAANFGLSQVGAYCFAQVGA